MLLGCVLIAVVAAVVLLAAVRGRRVDDHPHCRRCGYDLTGRAGDVCTECGTDLKRRQAVRAGQRKVRRGWAGLSAVVLGIGLVGVGTCLYGYRHDGWWRPYAPTWYLRHELTSSASQTRSAALSELSFRLVGGRLSRSQVNAVVDRCLALQADHSTPWVGVWGDFIDAARAAGQLDDQRWATYARQSYCPVLRVGFRPVLSPDATPEERVDNRRVWAGERTRQLELWLGYEGASVDGRVRTSLRHVFEARGTVDGYLVDGQPTAPLVYPSADGARPLAQTLDGGYVSCAYQLREMSESATAALMTGRHQMTVRMQVVLSEGDGRVVAAFDTEAAADFDVVGRADQPSRADDPRIANRIKWSLDPIVCWDDKVGRFVLWLSIDNPPVRVAFHAWVRRPGGGRPFDGGRVDVPAGGRFDRRVALDGWDERAERAVVDFAPEQPDGGPPTWARDVVVTTWIAPRTTMSAAR